LISDHPSQPDFFPQTRPTAFRLLEAAFADVTSIHDRQSAIFYPLRTGNEQDTRMFTHEHMHVPLGNAPMRNKKTLFTMSTNNRRG